MQKRNGFLALVIIFLNVPFVAFAQTVAPAALGEARAHECSFRCQAAASEMVKDTDYLNQPSDSVRNSVAPACPPTAGAANSDAVSTPPLLTSARKIMALMYGSCKAPNLPVRELLNPSSLPAASLGFSKKTHEFSLTENQKATVVASHPYLQDRLAPSCSDTQICKNSAFTPFLNSCEKAACFSLENPPIYQWGAKPKAMDIFVGNTAKEKNASGLDCSGYLFESMRAVGYRAYPNVPLSETGPNGIQFFNSYRFWDLGSNRKKSCFKRVMADPDLLPGDMIAEVQDPHVAMIGSVGKDPFGVDALLAKSKSQDYEDAYQARLNSFPPVPNAAIFKTLHIDDLLSGTPKNAQISPAIQADFLNGVAESACDQLLPRPEDYKVTIIHSAGFDHGGDVGVQQEKLFPGVGNATGTNVLSTAMIQKANISCVIKLRQLWLNSMAANVDPALKEAMSEDSKLIKSVKLSEQNSQASHVIRFDKSIAGCTASADQIPKLKNEECVSCCTYDISYEGLTTAPAI